ncbi:MAG TPA: chemotaxis protein CheC [Clostridia bacterium]|nr:chemotaxis protein CheC [Clostridia bacterium]
MENYENLNDIQKDVLREIGNIGGGNAATALSSILTDRVEMSVPKLGVIGINEITEILGGPENEVVGILVPMSEDVRGMLLFILDKHFTHLLINALLNKNIDSFENINEMDLSALKEMGNILSGSYISAISQLTNLNIMLSPPDIAIDMVGAILSYPAAMFGMMGDKVLFIEEDFFSGIENIKSHLLIMPEMESLEIMLNRLGVV